MSNSIAISRKLVAAGLEQKAADAIAEEIVTHSDDDVATKADIAKLEARITIIEQQIKMLIFMVGGVFIGIVLMLIQQLG